MPVASASEDSIFDILNEDEKVAVSVTKTSGSVNEAPAIVSVIRKEQIAEYNYTSVADALRHVPGFYITDDHILPNVAVRGVSGGLFSQSGLIKVMIDGHSMAFRSTSGNWLGAEAIPMTAIERIEIIRGPASALYGADAFLGVVNIVTRNGADIQGAKVRGGANLVGLNPGYDVDATVGGRLGNFSALLAARVNSEDRSGLALPPSSPAANVPSYRNGDVRARNMELASRVGELKLSYDFEGKGSLTLSAHFANIERGAEFASWAQMVNGYDERGRFNQTKISLYQGSLALDGKWAITDRFDLLLTSQFFIGGPTDRDQIDVGNSLFYVKRNFGYLGNDSVAEVRWRILDSLTTVLGVNFIYDQERTQTASRYAKVAAEGISVGQLLASSGPANPTKQLFNSGAYLQTTWTAIERYLNLVGGFRYDFHNIYGSQPSGRFGAVSSPREDLHFKLLYGGAFKAPSPLLLFATPLDVRDILGNPSLKPQYVHTFEAEARYEPLRFLSLSTGVSYNLIFNSAQFTLQGLNQVARNLNEIRSLSWESRVEARYEDWIKGYCSFELNNTQRTLGDMGYAATLVGSQNTVYPMAQVHVGANGRVPKVPLRASVEVSFASKRRASDSNILENGASYDLPPLILVGASISTIGLQFFPGKETALSVVARNLGGSTVADPGFAGIDYPVAPRTIYFLLRQDL